MRSYVYCSTYTHPVKFNMAISLLGHRALRSQRRGKRVVAAAARDKIWRMPVSQTAVLADFLIASSERW
jgi:hypothetical protein